MLMFRKEFFEMSRINKKKPETNCLRAFSYLDYRTMIALSHEEKPHQFLLMVCLKVLMCVQTFFFVLKGLLNSPANVK